MTRSASNGGSGTGNGRKRSGGPLVVIGDAFLDVDVVGGVDRLCPDAPVPVVDCHESRYRPGGAALAALLAATEELDVAFVTAVGDDPGGDRVRELLRDRVSLFPLPMDGTTQLKKRVWGNGTLLVRLDEGDGRAARDSGVPAVVRSVIRTARAILVSDYGRGVAAHPGLRELLSARSRGTPLVWDPHPRGAVPIRGADLVTPNESEAVALAPAPSTPRVTSDASGSEGPGNATADAVEEHSWGLDVIRHQATELREYWRCAVVAVTAASRGVVLADGVATPRHLPTPDVQSGGDTCGAGDRFAVAVTAALGNGMARTDAVRTGVNAASRFVASSGALGMATVGARSSDDVTANPGHDDPLALIGAARSDGKRVVATGGCFDVLHAGHASLLSRARALGDMLVVFVNDDNSVRRLKGPGRPIMSARDRVRLLEALGCVDAALLFMEDTPDRLLREVRPDVWVKGGDYDEDALPEAGVVRHYGGEVAILPRSAGRSTTELVSAIRGGH